MREQYIEYRDGEELLEGFLCYDEALPGPRPAVLLCHTWRGHDDFMERKARRLAWQGYACFALDNFGKGKRGTTPQECAALIERAERLCAEEGQKASLCKQSELAVPAHASPLRPAKVRGIIAAGAAGSVQTDPTTAKGDEKRW